MNPASRPLAVLALILLASSRSLAMDHDLEVGGSVLHVSILDARTKEELLLSWIETSARGVSAYFGRFPVPEVRLLVTAGSGRGVSHGVTYGGRMPSIQILVGRDVTSGDLKDDWVLTHEMTHLAFPDLADMDSWAEEGLATYVEPLARLQAGTVSVDKVWADLLQGLPNGLPEKGDGGLHGTEDWGRTYWGGALFWLLADVNIREKTAGRLGLPDALEALLRAGGDIRSKWTITKALTVSDNALGLTVLMDLYREYGVAPGRVDLPDLWARLGVRLEGGHVVFDEGAREAPIRRAITSPRPLGAGRTSPPEAQGGAPRIGSL